MNKKTITYLILIGIMLACFFLSGLFFLNSGIIVSYNGNCHINEDRGIQILNELDKLPIVQIDAYDLLFRSYGSVVDTSEESFSIQIHHDEQRSFKFNADEQPEISEGDEVLVFYKYVPEGGTSAIIVEKLPS